MNRSSIRTITESYLHTLDTLQATCEPLQVLARALRSSAAGAHLRALKTHAEAQTETEDRQQFRVPYRHLRQVDRLRRKHQRSECAVKLLPRSCLVALVQAYRAFLQNLIQELLRLQPAAMAESTHTLNYQALLHFEDITTARRALARAQAETVMRLPAREQIRWLERVFGVSSLHKLIDWPVFDTAFEKYAAHIGDGDGLSRRAGDAATAGNPTTPPTADQDFLPQAYACFYEAGVKLSQMLWRRLLPDSIGQADASLSGFANELLNDEKPDQARRLLEFALDSLPRYSSENVYRTFVIDLALACKLSGDTQACAERIGREDWSACGENFLICLQILRDDYTTAADYMRRIGSHGSVREWEYEQRAIFRDFRESDEFRQAFTEVFGKPPATNMIWPPPD